MQIIETVNRMQETAVQQRTQGRLIALVPTSGAIHEGLLSLVKQAQEKADTVVVSIFVNPLEFGPNEDFDRFPRSRENDLEACEKAGVDMVFIPTAKEMYPAGYSTKVTEDSYAQGLCGISRPNYYRGVCTVYVKLFNVIRPDLLMMGLRDAQQVAVVRKLIADLNFPLSVEVGEVVRAADGLALNARNAYLNEFQRRDATLLYTALSEGKRLVDSGINNVDRVLAEVIHHLSQSRRLRVIHVSAVDPETMQARREIIRGETLVIAAVWCDEVRLLDCLSL
jgi:pantoate--beta-alanine ligase